MPLTSLGTIARVALNQWIRTSGAFDGVVDADQVLRDPSQPTRLLPAYDSGDHLHPNTEGGRAAANSIDPKAAALTTRRAPLIPAESLGILSERPMIE